MNSNQLLSQLVGEWASPTVDDLGDGSYLIAVPSHRLEHDTIPVLVERSGSGDRPWTLSDDGYTAFLLGDRFDEIAELVESSPFAGCRVIGRRLELASPEAQLGAAAVYLAYEIGGLLTASRARDAYKQAKGASARADSSARVMAQEVKSRIEERSPWLGPFCRLRRTLRVGTLSARAPFAINGASGEGVPPLLVASAVDLTQTGQSVRAGLATTSLVLDLAAKLGIGRRFVVVRGESSYDDLADLYDRDGVVVVPTTEMTPLLDTASELEAELRTIPT